ncbi:MAG: type secretion protein EccC [Actinomycetia bacterium]|nr:type secretion protein EccC [Actinomycetes bacterium]
MTAILPMAGVMGSLVMMTIIRSGAFIVLGAIVLVVAGAGGLLLVMSHRGQAGRARKQQRERYLDYLERLREELAAAEREDRARGGLLHPPPFGLYDVVRDPARLWERRRTDHDFLSLRAGAGQMPGPAMHLKEQGSALQPPDPFMLAEATALMRRFSVAADMPLTVPMDRVGNISVVADREAGLAVVRALLAQLAVFHAPDDVELALAIPQQRRADWGWITWLPHVLDPGLRDGPVAARRIAPDPAALTALLREDLTQRATYAAEIRRGLEQKEALTLMRRLVVVHDGHGAPARELPRPDEAVSLQLMGITVVHLVAQRVHEPGSVAVRITVGGDQITIEDLREELPVVSTGALDATGPATAEALARMLAPLRLSADSVEDTPYAGAADFATLMGIPDLDAPNLTAFWAPRSERAFLRVPIGTDDTGSPVLLDLKEAAQLGMGPHGLCVGATGSGKSELLRTLVLALAATHPPEQLAMMLIDYKGGATFAPFADLPHVAGLITNLEDDAALIERAHASLAGEVQHRQQVLRNAGDIANIGDYAALRSHRPELEPLPHLLVVIDEFAELLTARPDFIDLLVSIGRIGRSIGVHLLLSSQRIEAGKLRGLETYLSYRLALRTFSEDESRAVLESPDAFHLPPLPGFAYLKVDTSVYLRFKATYVSGAYRPPLTEPEPADSTGPLVLPYGLYNLTLNDQQSARAAAQPTLPERTTGPTPLKVLATRLTEAAGDIRVPRIWLPPLPECLTLDQIAGPIRVDADGMHLRQPPGSLQIPLGLLDDPARQRQDLWTLDLTTGGGHVAVMGAPQSGKTTLLRTLILSLALTHTPRQVAVYVLDLTGAGLHALTGLPHVGGVASRADRERIRRTLEEIRAMLTRREDVFRTRGIDSVERLRQLHAAGHLPELPCAEVVLVIDGFSALRSDFDDLEEAVADLLQRGGGYGIHVVAGMPRWNDVRIALQSTFGTRVELRLGDPAESTVNRRLAETLNSGSPGRALTDAGLFAHTALPRIDGHPHTAGVIEAIESTASAIRAAWPGDLAPAVRVLPHRLPAIELPPLRRERQRIPIGVDETDLAPVVLDLFHHDQNLLIFGDGECGKTNLLRLIATGLVTRHDPSELVLAVFDPRRGLRGIVDDEYLGGYADSIPACAALATGVCKILAERRPGEAAPTGQPWFTGPHIVVLADDYDIITTAGQQPLSDFVPHVPSGRDIGLHFIVTRRVAGASRGLYDPLVQAVRETGSAALLMTGDRGEGQLFPGLYADAQPPGRGHWLRRGEPRRLIQTALSDNEPR